MGVISGMLYDDAGAAAPGRAVVVINRSTHAVAAVTATSDGSGDANFDDVTLLLRGDGTAGSTTVTDSGPLGLSPSSSAGVVVAAEAAAFGTGALAFNRTGEIFYDSSLPAIGAGDYTIEARIKWTPGYASGSTQYGVFQLCTGGAYSTSNSTTIAVFVNTGDTWALYAGDVRTSSVVVNTSAPVHLVIERYGSTTTLYINGVAATSFTDTTDYTSAGGVIGGYYSSAFRFHGWLDELRITKGVARYQGAFTPPSGPHLTDVGAAVGSYSAPVPAGTYTVLFLDDEAGTQHNALVRDRVVVA